MNRKSLRQLAIWLISALIITTIIQAYVRINVIPSIKDCYSSLGEPCSLMLPFEKTHINIAIYLFIIGIVIVILKNIVITVWLFKTSKTKKLLWGLFGILTGWWALFAFALYQYHVKDLDEIELK